MTAPLTAFIIRLKTPQAAFFATARATAIDIATPSACTLYTPCPANDDDISNKMPTSRLREVALLISILTLMYFEDFKSFGDVRDDHSVICEFRFFATIFSRAKLLIAALPRERIDSISLRQPKSIDTATRTFDLRRRHHDVMTTVFARYDQFHTSVLTLFIKALSIAIIDDDGQLTPLLTTYHALRFASPESHMAL
jgi:hypothetical protein